MKVDRDLLRNGYPYLVIGGMHLAAFVFFYNYFFLHVNLMCGDSAFYWALSQSPLGATPDRPSGWPFVIHLFRHLSDGPRILLFVNAGLVLATHVFLFRVIRRYVSLGFSLLLSCVVYLNPSVYGVSSMALMSDSFVYSLIVLALCLLVSAQDRKATPRIVILGIMLLLVSYGMIVKSVFVYAGIPLVAAALFQVATLQGLAWGKKAALGLLMIGGTAAIPCAYAYGFAAPILKSPTIEGFGGRAVLATTIGHLPGCEALVNIADLPYQDIVRAECQNDRLAHENYIQQVFSESSTLRRIGERIVREDRPAMDESLYVNRVYQRWLRNALTKYPKAFLQVIWAGIALSMQKPDHMDIYGGLLFGLSGGCEKLTDSVFHLPPEIFLSRLRQHQQQTATIHGFLRGYATGLLGVFNGLVYALTLVFPAIFAFIAFRQKRISLILLPLLLYLFISMYIVSIYLGSTYDVRYGFLIYPTWLLICVLSVKQLHIGLLKGRA